MKYGSQAGIVCQKRGKSGLDETVDEGEKKTRTRDSRLQRWDTFKVHEKRCHHEVFNDDCVYPFVSPLMCLASAVSPVITTRVRAYPFMHIPTFISNFRIYSHSGLLAPRRAPFGVYRTLSFFASSSARGVQLPNNEAATVGVKDDKMPPSVCVCVCGSE